MAFDVASLLEFIAASPSPYHAVATRGGPPGGGRFQRAATRPTRGPTCPSEGYVVRGGAIVAWRRPDGAARPRARAPRRRPHRLAEPAHQAATRTRARSAGASSPSRSTAAPCRTRGSTATSACRAASCWHDGDVRLVRADRPLARVAQLAIHLDRDVNERGLVLDKQQHLTPIWGLGQVRDGQFALLARRPGRRGRRATSPRGTSCSTTSRRPTPPGRRRRAHRLGPARQPVLVLVRASRRSALVKPRRPRAARGAVRPRGGRLVDRPPGAAGPLLEHVLDPPGRRRAAPAPTTGPASLAASVCVSADMAHAVHPNYPERHEPEPPAAAQRRARC